MNFESPKEYVLRACILPFFVLITGHIECAVFVFLFNLWFAYMAKKKQEEYRMQQEERVRQARLERQKHKEWYEAYWKELRKKYDL